MEAKSSTPQRPQNAIVNKVIANTISCDSPFKRLPNISTPPSRFAKIKNPFESHLIDRLHLPVFSPSVFAQMSTPETEKFKWTIDDISSFKPADIDEMTIHQHVIDHDPTVESLVQEKIDSFFNHKVIVPSPATGTELSTLPLIADSPIIPVKPKLCDGVAQTVLTLPPKLPQHLEDLLKPFMTYTVDQQQSESDNAGQSSLYQKLFDFAPQVGSDSLQSSPALSTGLSPIQFSPLLDNGGNNKFGTPVEIADWKDCGLSPIGRSPRHQSRSACRLNFSEDMSIGTSLIVPDIHQATQNNLIGGEQTRSMRSMQEMSNASMNWDMEYKQVSIPSRPPTPQSPEITSSNSNTPHSKMFTSQRKRLSDSFKDDQAVAGEDGSDGEKDVEMVEEFYQKRSKSRLHLDNNVTDLGYHTVSSTWSSLHMFASTPSKNHD